MVSLRKSRREVSGILPLDRMAGMAIGGGLIDAILCTAAACNRSECEYLPGSLAYKLIVTIGQNAGVPKRLAFIGHKDRITCF